MILCPCQPMENIMNYHLTFDFDYNYQTEITTFLDSLNLNYQIIETEITIHHLTSNQLIEITTFLEQ